MREPPQSERRRASASALRERAFKSRNILAGTRFLSIQFEGLRSGKSPPPNAVSDVRRANCPAAIGKAAAPAKNACPRPENFRLQIAGEISILVFLIMIPDVLAERYASKAMRQIWSAEGKILLERDLWIAVMKAQKELGLDIPQEAIDAYERVKGEIRIDEINRREKITRHDVKARIEEFCGLAGFEHIHKGMTSRDLTECVEQLQCRRSLELVRTKAAAALALLSQKARAYKGEILAARTHNVIAQLTTFGKRLAEFGEDFLRAAENIQSLLDSYPVRGIKGAVGTQLDQLTLFDGDASKARALDEKIRKFLGISRCFGATGQVYPRALDFEVASRLFQLASGPSSFAKTLRIMAGAELASEGFAKGQTGSSAMPHKMNSRSCERINGFQAILRGFMEMGSALAGDQWNEGDVSCSVVRRVMLPGAFFAIDGLLETFITVLGQMRVNSAVIEAERRKYMPFLLTTTVMMKAVKKGMGREDAHEVIKEHAVAAANDMRAGKISENDLLARLAADPRMPLDAAELGEILKEGSSATGLAEAQTEDFCDRADAWAGRFPEAKDYAPEPIL